MKEESQWNKGNPFLLDQRELTIGKQLFRVSLVSQWAGGRWWIDTIVVEIGKKKRDKSVEWNPFRSDEEPPEVFAVRKELMPILTKPYTTREVNHERRIRGFVFATRAIFTATDGRCTHE